MKNTTLFLMLIVATLLGGCSTAETETRKGQTVNPVLGDISFEHAFG